jgi:hypothetical protein
VPTRIFYPNWRKHGRIAGILRNKDIVNHSSRIVAFWDGVSKGTQNSIATAYKVNKPVTIIKF